MESPTELFSRAERAINAAGDVITQLHACQAIIAEQRGVLANRITLIVERIALAGRHAAECFARGQAEDYERALTILRRYVGLADQMLPAIALRVSGSGQHA